MLLLSAAGSDNRKLLVDDVAKEFVLKIYVALIPRFLTSRHHRLYMCKMTKNATRVVNATLLDEYANVISFQHRHTKRGLPPYQNTTFFFVIFFFLFFDIPVAMSQCHRQRIFIIIISIILVLLNINLYIIIPIRLTYLAFSPIDLYIIKIIYDCICTFLHHRISLYIPRKTRLHISPAVVGPYFLHS